MQCLRNLISGLALALTATLPLAGVAGDTVATPRVIGGLDAPVNRWPWMAQLAIVDPATPGGYLLCGASHLSTRWILTAAHCLEYPNGALVPASNVYVFIGDTDRNNNPTSGIQAQQVLIHRLYSDLNHDLALIRIPARNNSEWPSIITVDGSDALEAAPFSLRDEAVTALGWGQTGSGLSNDLQEVQLDYVPRSQCRQSSPLSISNFVICAAELNPVSGRNQDTCFGDSGGPLFVGRDRSPWLAGLTSFGESICATGAPGGYTHLAAETAELEALTASAGFPLVDLNLFWSFAAPPRYYALPGASQTLTLTLENSGSTTINNPTLNLSLSGGTSATSQWNSCSSGNLCTPVSNFTGSRTQSLTVNGNNGQDQVVTVNVQGSADQEEYRRRNNSLQQVIVFSNNPDIALSARTIATTADRATLSVTLRNLSTLNSASGTAVEFALPSGMTLANADTLGCTGSSLVRCPLGTLAPDSAKVLNLQIDSRDSITRMLNFQGTLNERDIPAGDTQQSVTISFSAPPSTSTGSSGGGGFIFVGWLLTLSLLGLRRRPCPPP